MSPKRKSKVAGVRINARGSSVLKKDRKSFEIPVPVKGWKDCKIALSKGDDGNWDCVIGKKPDIGRWETCRNAFCALHQVLEYCNLWSHAEKIEKTLTDQGLRSRAYCDCGNDGMEDDDEYEPTREDVVEYPHDDGLEHDPLPGEVVLVEMDELE